MGLCPLLPWCREMRYVYVTQRKLSELFTKKEVELQEPNETQSTFMTYQVHAPKKAIQIPVPSRDKSPLY